MSTVVERREQAEGRQIMREIAGFTALLCVVIWFGLLIFQQALFPQQIVAITSGGAGILQETINAGGWRARLHELYTLAFLLLLVVPFGTHERVRRYGDGPGGFAATIGSVGIFLMVLVMLITAATYELMARLYLSQETRAFAITIADWVIAVFEGQVMALGILFIGLWVAIISLIVPPNTLMSRILSYYGLLVALGLLTYGVTGTFRSLLGTQLLGLTRGFFWVLFPFWVLWVGFWLLRPDRLLISDPGEQVLIVSPDTIVTTPADDPDASNFEIIPEGSEVVELERRGQ